MNAVTIFSQCTRPQLRAIFLEYIRGTLDVEVELPEYPSMDIFDVFIYNFVLGAGDGCALKIVFRILFGCLPFILHEAKIKLYRISEEHDGAIISINQSASHPINYDVIDIVNISHCTAT
jgi:hypothetical protein